MATSLPLASIIGAVTAATGYRYGVRDDVGNRMDTLTVIDSPAGGYLGVYHTGDQVNLATSNDLLTWSFRRTLDPQATQPSIVALPTGGFLTAVEYNNQTGSGGRVRLRHYPTCTTGTGTHPTTGTTTSTPTWTTDQPRGTPCSPGPRGVPPMRQRRRRVSRDCQCEQISDPPIQVGGASLDSGELFGHVGQVGPAAVPCSPRLFLRG